MRLRTPFVSTDLERTFLTLVRENDTRLRRICRVYAADVDGRQDLYQEMLLQLWRSLPSFLGASSPNTWLYRVALNTALSQARRPLSPETRLDEEHAPEAMPHEDLDARVDAANQSERLYAAIDRLDRVDKMLVTMYLDDRSYREMADVIGISENYVGVKLNRIRKTLARSLTEEPV